MKYFPEIKFEDIEAGDVIHEVTENNGTHNTTEYIVHQTDDPGNWITPDGRRLRKPNDGTTLYLIARNAVKLPTKPGSIIIDATTKDGLNLGALMLNKKNEWFKPDDEDQVWSANEIGAFKALGKIIEA